MDWLLKFSVALHLKEILRKLTLSKLASCRLWSSLHGKEAVRFAISSLGSSKSMSRVRCRPIAISPTLSALGPDAL